MDYKKQFEKLREEENILLRRIEKKIRMQGILKKQQSRINMLRKLAGEEDEDVSPTPMEVEEISKKESQRTTEISRKVFCALQEVNTQGTFCKKASVIDKDTKAEYEVNAIVTVKCVKQSESVVRPINLNLTIKNNAIDGKISFVKDSDDAIPCTLDKVIDKFKADNKENRPRSTRKPKIVSDVRVCLPRLKLDEHSQRSTKVAKQCEQRSAKKCATETKPDEERLEKEIAQLKVMLAHAKRSSSGLGKSNDGDDLTKGLPRNQKSRRSPLAGVMKPVVSGNTSTMIPADTDPKEEVMDVPMASIEPQEPEVREEPEVPEEEPEIPEEHPEDPDEGASQMTDDNIVGERTDPDQGGSQQQAAVILKYIV
ncbi:hypothetical protein RF55_14289 [Lasius niger]|uniref:Uncharacterized protein n=1 Tax=Lasius niger TaxID=67767 RepID=A0A0J7K8Z2_LASNI|nr:hypothetical protein RF55_14289 [Lasius niger]